MSEENHNFTEQDARITINRKLQEAGWVLEGKNKNVLMEQNSTAGFMDYLLLDKNGRNLGLVEAKKDTIDPYTAKNQARMQRRKRPHENDEAHTLNITDEEDLERAQVRFQAEAFEEAEQALSIFSHGQFETFPQAHQNVLLVHIDEVDELLDCGLTAEIIQGTSPETLCDILCHSANTAYLVKEADIPLTTLLAWTESLRHEFIDNAKDYHRLAKLAGFSLNDFLTITNIERTILFSQSRKIVHLFARAGIHKTNFLALESLKRQTLIDHTKTVIQLIRQRSLTFETMSQLPIADLTSILGDPQYLSDNISELSPTAQEILGVSSVAPRMH